MDNERNNYALDPLQSCNVGAQCKPKTCVIYVSWEHTVLPYDVVCATV